MARRVLNRKVLREQADAADAAAEASPATEGVAPKAASGKAAKVKAAAAPRAKKPRKKKEPERLRARWGVFDGGMKQVAIFDYNQRAEADQRVADLKAKKNGTFFLQIVKEAMPAAVPAETPAD